jgi:type VI secretion system protein ImpA
MASPAVLDFAKLLTPISAEKPTGVDLRADKSPTSFYYEIKGARNAARDVEKLILRGESPPQQPDWKSVQKLCEKALGEQTKDLEITAYLIEALLRVHEFRGLRDGFQLAAEFVDRFWDKLFPAPDEDGESTRTKPLEMLNNAEAMLIVPIGRVPIAAGSFLYAEYKEGLRLKQSTDAKVRQKGDAALEGFKKAKEETPAQFYVALVEDLSACIKEFAKLSEALKKKCGDNGPPTSAIRSALTEFLDLAKSLAPEPAKEQPAETARAESGKPSPTTPNKPEAAAPGVIGNRKQALETLQKVAVYFREAEPHSPVSYNLEQAIRWANLPLPALLNELIAEEAPRKNVFKQVGIVPEPPKAAQQK